MPTNDPTEDTDDMPPLVPATVPQDRSMSERKLKGFPSTGQRRFASFAQVAGREESAALGRAQRELREAQDRAERDARAG